MVLGKKRWLLSIGNGAGIRPLEKGRSTAECDLSDIYGSYNVLSNYMLSLWEMYIDLASQSLPTGKLTADAIKLEIWILYHILSDFSQ